MKNTPITGNSENDKQNISAKDQKAQLEEVLSSINEVVWVRRAGDMVITYINKACEKVYGCSPDELIGTCGVLFENIHPDDREKLEQETQKTLTDGKGKLEYRIFNKNGDLRYISGEAYVKKDEHGKPLTISGISRDITELRLTEKNLRDKADEIENIFESITDSFIALDKNFNFTFANKGAPGHVWHAKRRSYR